MSHKKSVKQLNDDIHRFLTGEDYDSALNALREGLGAEHVVRKNRDDGERGVQYSDVPDHTTRLHAARLLLEYGFGRPATRHEIAVTDETKKTASPAEIMNRLRDSGQNLANILDVYTDSLNDAEIEPQKTMELVNNGE